MGNLGSSELLLILVLALLLLGPRRLPEVGASLGRMLRRFRQASRDLRTEMDVDRVLRLDDEPPPAPEAPAATEPRRSKPQAPAVQAAADPTSAAESATDTSTAADPARAPAPAPASPPAVRPPAPPAAPRDDDDD